MTPAAARAATHGAGLEDPVTGLVRRVFEVSADPRDPEVAVVVAVLADITRYGDEEEAASDGSGAGLEVATAYGAAVGECCERYALATVQPERFHVASWRELPASSRPAAPSRWALFDAEQHRRGLPFEPFTEDTRLAWIEASHLAEPRAVFVPACFVTVPYPARAEARAVAPGISTGAACASSVEDALLGGLCELIERDTFMIAWRNRLPLPRVRVGDDHRLARVVAERFGRPHLDYAVFHTTLDLGVPSFFGLVRDRSRKPAAVVAGGAAHPDPARGYLKTLLEVTQGLRWLDNLRDLPEQRDERGGFDDIRSFEDRVRLYGFGGCDEAFAFLEDGAAEVSLGDIAPFPADGRLGSIVERLEACGVGALAVDIAPADVRAAGLCVLKALAPELETMEGDHTMPFLGGERWRRVPVELGLRSTAPALDELNPWPHPYP